MTFPRLSLSPESMSVWSLNIQEPPLPSSFCLHVGLHLSGCLGSLCKLQVLPQNKQCSWNTNPYVMVAFRVFLAGGGRVSCSFFCLFKNLLRCEDDVYVEAQFLWHLMVSSWFLSSLSCNCSCTPSPYV